MQLARDYLTMQAAVALTGYQRHTLNYPVGLGLVRFIRVGRLLLVSRSSLLRYMRCRSDLPGRPRGPENRRPILPDS